MLTVALAITMLQGPKLAENAAVDFSGIPEISGGDVAITSHSVTVELNKTFADVTSLTLVKNNGAAGRVDLTIPRAHADKGVASSAHFDVQASWANAPIALSQAMRSCWGADLDFLSGKGAMVAGGSYALRVHYRVPLGKAGFDRKQLIAAYDLSSSLPIGQVNVTYRYAPKVVFHLPSAHPNLGWQIGTKGVFVRLTNYAGEAGVSYVTFYPGGFKDIGG